MSELDMFFLLVAIGFVIAGVVQLFREEEDAAALCFVIGGPSVLMALGYFLDHL